MENTSNETILITGATGYLGSNLLRYFFKTKKQPNIIILTRNGSNTFRIHDFIDKVKVYNLDKIETETIFRENNINTIIHCATDYGRLNTDPIKIIETNIIFPLNLLCLCRKYKVRRFINTDTVLDKSVSNYALSKNQFKDWLIKFSDNMTCVNIALEHFYGPNDDKTKFVSYIIDELIKEAPKINLTKGEQKRDFVYIDDIVDAFDKIIKRTKNIDIGFYDFNIGTGEQITIKDFVEMVKCLSENTTTILDYGAIPYRENELMGHKIDLSAITNIGWVPKFTIKDGIINTINIEKIKI